MIQEHLLQEIYKKFAKKVDSTLSPYACHDNEAQRLKQETEQEFRSAFAIDRDRILYSGAYRRYQGKTQVFSFSMMIDEEMSNRSIHTTYVSQISRTIGKVLDLNVELIEAIALGHDLGHSPVGHDAERALSNICQKTGIGHFCHNVESLHIVDNISRKGEGLNLSFQVRDGILSHDGEVHNTKLVPFRDKTEDDFEEYINVKKQGKSMSWMPATLEGCVVRISDTIAYIGQDIEDAIRMGILKRDELPEECTNYLGNRNSQIIDTLVKSVITESWKKNYIAFDKDTSHHLKQLKQFNYSRIYTSTDVKTSNDKIYRSMELLFNKYLTDFQKKNHESKLFRHFLDFKSDRYLSRFSPEEMVRDFIATMTDRYFNEEVKDYLLPGRF
ncbi:MAG: HD domain-containing protein [Candidatus Cloacimonetes bacterium]|nr:HD domain-containing protein [Candidatus Cloacimonadota bacterium]